MSATVIFRLDGEHYGIGIDAVQEIIPLLQVSQVPQMPHDWYGIANVRGSVTPIIDLRQHMGLTQRAPELDTPIVIVVEGQRQLGLLVDAITTIAYDTPHAAVIRHQGNIVVNLEVSTIFAKTPDVAER